MKSPHISHEHDGESERLALAEREHRRNEHRKAEYVARRARDQVAKDPEHYRRAAAENRAQQALRNLDRATLTLEHLATLGTADGVSGKTRAQMAITLRHIATKATNLALTLQANEMMAGKPAGTA